MKIINDGKELNWGKIIWDGQGIHEVGIRSDNNQIVVRVDKNLYRPSEVDTLLGDPTKAKEKLGWVPEHDLASLVKDMMHSDVTLMQKEQYLKAGGYNTKN